MWIGNVFTVCVSVYLSALVSVSAFVTVWARTFEVVYLENSFFFLTLMQILINVWPKDI